MHGLQLRQLVGTGRVRQRGFGVHADEAGAWKLASMPPCHHQQGVMYMHSFMLHACRGMGWGSGDL